MVIGDSNMTSNELSEFTIENSELEVIGRLVDASNASLLCVLPEIGQVIYKPIAGERPLWDFPDGNLASREVIAYYISELGKFFLVPKTVLRDGPFGMGAAQIWIDVDEEIDVVKFAQSQDPRLRSLAIFDAIINNADRKFGHILLAKDGQLFGCDHGVSFHEEDKLRTVIWQFADQDLTDSEVVNISEILREIDETYLSGFITEAEISALKSRCLRLIEGRKFPLPNPNWPAIPWPPY